MGSAVGKIAGTVLGTAVGGPMCGQIGGQIGGSLFGGSKSGGGQGSAAQAGAQYGMGEAMIGGTQQGVEAARRYMEATRFSPYQTQLLGGGVTAMDGGLSVGMAPGYEAAFQESISRVPSWMQGISQDPFEMQKRLYQQQAAIFEPEYEKQQLGMEKRLLAQGMLGSTGGAERMRGLLEAQDVGRQKAMISAYDLGQQAVDLAQQRRARDLASSIGLTDLSRTLAQQSLTGGQMAGQVNLEAYKPFMSAEQALAYAQAQKEGAKKSALFGGLGALADTAIGAFGSGQSGMFGNAAGGFGGLGSDYTGASGGYEGGWFDPQEGYVGPGSGWSGSF